MGHSKTLASPALERIRSWSRAWIEFAFSITGLLAGTLCLQLAVSACARPSAQPSATPSAEALLDHAITAAGGADALQRAERLRWTGDAVVHAGGRDIALIVHSDIEPFGRVRSESWLRDAGPTSMRSMVFEEGGAFLERNGRREPMPETMARNERVQYGTYALMRLVTLRETKVRIRRSAPDAAGRAGLEVDYPGLPHARLYFAADGRLASLVNTVPAPDGKGELAQRFEFEGLIESHGVRWPRTLCITQDGKPFFDLRLRSFEALPAGGSESRSR